MVKETTKDILIFRKAEPATKAELQIAIDLADTLRANRDICVGMAANMIGVNKRIIAFAVGAAIVTMLNPKIIKCSGGSYEAEEGCHCREHAKLHGTMKFQSNMRICHLRSADRAIPALLLR